MLRGGWPVFLIAAGCAGADDEALSALDGAWTGTLEDSQPLALVATFEWRADDELLFGSVTTQLPAEPAPWVFAVRRWDVDGGTVYLDLTDEVDPTRGLDLDGEVDGNTFGGAAVLSYACDQGTCGYEGDFTLTRGPSPVTGTPTTGGTGQSTP